jgi:hypothetical protein
LIAELDYPARISDEDHVDSRRRFLSTHNDLLDVMLRSACSLRFISYYTIYYSIS